MDTFLGPGTLSANIWLLSCVAPLIAFCIQVRDVAQHHKRWRTHNTAYTLALILFLTTVPFSHNLLHASPKDNTALQRFQFFILSLLHPLILSSTNLSFLSYTATHILSPQSAGRSTRFILGLILLTITTLVWTVSSFTFTYRPCWRSYTYSWYSTFHGHCADPDIGTAVDSAIGAGITAVIFIVAKFTLPLSLRHGTSTRRSVVLHLCGLGTIVLMLCRAYFAVRFDGDGIINLVLIDHLSLAMALMVVGFTILPREKGSARSLMLDVGRDHVESVAEKC